MSDFIFRLFGVYPEAQPDVFGAAAAPGIGMVLWLLTTIACYPAFWLFLRRAKKIPLRFNSTAFAALVSLAVLPVLLSTLTFLNAVSSIEMLSTVTTTENYLLDHTIVCQGDRTKLDAGRIQLSKTKMADAVSVWNFNNGQRSISSSAWLNVANPCEYSAVGLAAKEELALQSVRIAQRSCLIAVIVVGIIGLLSLYSLVVREIATDLRATGGPDRVALTKVEQGFVALIVTLLFFPFGLYMCRLFKSESKRA
jgi:energy-coupling factor transporter transmembrane protein EcfT